MTQTFFISDTHFFHKNILDFEDRPYKTIDEMKDKMIEAWNNTVSVTDTIYIS